ncbi:hypothetical protein [Saccharothrix australiensis]|uniref:Uncharacterized protein n=1 Tax=Saccharothrix australiensis TaxID=2072 RepID=A0A495VZQ5_9PSEU|nr:hypothetical protein [Saccharothrix australiensis]RKT53865.1 hypothetical protein C8E97_2451 [Saccharothrix australiensis]
MSGPTGEAQDPEEFAEDVGVDPTPQEVDRYRELADEVPPWSGAEDEDGTT